MSSGVRVNDLRLAFIWVETVPDLLGDAKPSGPLAFLGSGSEYEEQYERLRQGAALPMGLRSPWSRSIGHHFWSFYLNLEKRDAGTVTGRQAWKQLLPLRADAPTSAVTAPWLPRPAGVEAYFYPCGTALVITVRCQGSYSLDEAVEVAFRARSAEPFDVRWSDGAAERLRLPALAGECLARLRRQGLGPDASPGARPPEPFTVCTVVSATGLAPDVPVAQAPDIQRRLYALAAWQANWLYSDLPPLEDATVPKSRKKRSGPGDVLYGTERGRVVWFPTYFVQPAGQFHVLNCYHNNLMLTSLQVESLSNLLRETPTPLAEWDRLATDHQTCAKRAAEVLGRMYLGGDKTYQSGSAKQQIEQNVWHALADVRYRVSLPPL